MDHRSSCAYNRSVLPLCNPVLLGVVSNSHLSPDALSRTKVIKIIGGILPSVIRPQTPDLLPRWVLHKSFKLLEPLQDFLKLLALQKVDAGLPGMVINECHIILISSQGNRRHRCAQI